MFRVQGSNLLFEGYRVSVGRTPRLGGAPLSGENEGIIGLGFT